MLSEQLVCIADRDIRTNMQVGVALFTHFHIVDQVDADQRFDFTMKLRDFQR